MMEKGIGYCLFTEFYANSFTVFICDQIFFFEDKHSQNQELDSHVKKGNRILYLFKEEGIK